MKRGKSCDGGQSGRRPVVRGDASDLASHEGMKPRSHLGSGCGLYRGRRCARTLPLGGHDVGGLGAEVNDLLAHALVVTQASTSASTRTLVKQASGPEHQPGRNPNKQPRRGDGGHERGGLKRWMESVHQNCTRATPANEENPRVNGGFLRRYRWDLNPRWSCPHTCFRDMILRPLGHGTGKELTRSGRHGAPPPVRSPSTGGRSRTPVPSSGGTRHVPKIAA